jgi:hypothetical protein
MHRINNDYVRQGMDHLDQFEGIRGFQFAGGGSRNGLGCLGTQASARDVTGTECSDPRENVATRWYG